MEQSNPNQEIRKLIHEFRLDDEISDTVEQLLAIGTAAVPYLTRALFSNSLRERIGAAFTLEKLAPPHAISHLLKALETASEEFAEPLLRALGHFDTPEVFEAVFNRLSDPSDRIRVNALAIAGKFSCGREKLTEYLLKQLPVEEYYHARGSIIRLLGHSGDARALEHLINVLEKEENPGLKCSAAYALGELKDLRAVEPLLNALLHPHWTLPSAATNALVALGTGVIPSLLEVVVEESTDPKIKSRAITALSVLEASEAIPLLEAIFENQQNEPELRASAAAGLIRLLEVSQIEVVFIALNNPDENIEVRKSIATTLGLTGKAQLQPMLQALSDEKLGLYLSESLANMGNQFLPELIQILDNSPNSEERYVVTGAFFRLGIIEKRFSPGKKEIEQLDKKIAVLIRALQDESSKVREQAALALGSYQDERALLPLLSVLKDPEAQVRFYAAQSLSRLNSFDQTHVEALIAALEDSREEVGWFVGGILGRLKNPRAVLPLLNQLKSNNNLTQRNTIQALGELGDNRAVKPLFAFTRKSRNNLQYEAIVALGKINTDDSY